MRGWLGFAVASCVAGLGLYTFQHGCASSSQTAHLALRAPEAPPTAAHPFLKGQLHAHTNHSGDSETPPSEVHAWYEARGYDFVVFTDHQRITDTPDTRLLTIAGVELTQNRKSCTPAPAPGDACLLHVNALFVDSTKEVDFTAARSAPDERVSIYGRLLEQAKDLGGIAMLNHPNMQYGASAEVLAELARTHGFTLLEVLNQAHDAQNQGDDSHPSTEKLWDSLLSKGFRVYATATDDAHHYDDAERARARGDDVFPGDLGFVMVRSGRDPTAIRDAIRRGDFYASTGPILSELKLDPQQISAALESGEGRFEVIGRDGRVLYSTIGERIAHHLDALDGYARLRVVGKDGRVALTQPVFQ